MPLHKVAYDNPIVSHASPPPTSNNMSSSHTTSESTLTLPDNHSVYTKTWSPTQTPSARLVFIHGFSDHCNAYQVLFPTLASAPHNIKVFSFDQRGWGRSVHSPAEKGLTGGTKQVLDDITFFIQKVLENETEEEKNTPLFLMGHSMGGGEVLTWPTSAPEDVRSRVRGYLLESPFVSLHESEKPWKAKVAIGRLAGKLLPKFQLVQPLPPSKLSRDPERCEWVSKDPLCHDTGTLEGLAGMLDRAGHLETESVWQEGLGEGGKTRVWVGFGSGDQILSEKLCRKWFERAKVEDKEYRMYEGWYHQLHAEPGEDKITFAKDVAKWILDRSGPLESLGNVVKPKL